MTQGRPSRSRLLFASPAVDKDFVATQTPGLSLMIMAIKAWAATGD